MKLKKLINRSANIATGYDVSKLLTKLLRYLDFIVIHATFAAHK